MAKKKKKVTQPKTKLGARYFVACDSVSRDPNSGKPTLYGVFDRIYSDKVPFHFRSFNLFCQLTGEGRVPMELSLVEPSGERSKLTSIEVEFADAGLSYVDMTLSGIKFSKFGNYVFEIKHGRTLVARTYEIAVTKPEKSKK